MTHTFASTADSSFLINVWAVDNAVNKFRVLGGVSADVDESQGYIEAYQRTLDAVMQSGQASGQAIDVVDHVITEYLIGRRN